MKYSHLAHSNRRLEDGFRRTPLGKGVRGTNHLAAIPHQQEVRTHCPTPYNIHYVSTYSFPIKLLFRNQKLEKLHILPLIISSLSNVRRSKVVKLNSSFIPCGGHTRHEQDFAFLYGQGYSGLSMVTVAFSSTATRPPHTEETVNKWHIYDNCSNSRAPELIG